MTQNSFEGVEYSIRAELPEDREAIHRLHQAAFGGNAEANLVDALRDSGDLEVSLVAARQGDVIGHILFSRVLIVTAQGNVPALSLAPMAIQPAFQRNGIGTCMMQIGLECCRTKGHQIVLVLGHPEFYRRFGFSSGLAEQIASPFGGGEAWMAQELVQGAMNGMVGRVEFSPPFAALE